MALRQVREFVQAERLPAELVAADPVRRGPVFQEDRACPAEDLARQLMRSGEWRRFVSYRLSNTISKGAFIAPAEQNISQSAQ